MDLSRLSLADKLVAGGAIVLLVSTFLPWYSWSLGNLGVIGASQNISLWNSSNFVAFMFFLAAVVAVGLIVLRALDVFDLSDQGVSEGLIILIAAGASGLLALLRLVSVPTVAGIFGAGRSWGLWIGLIAVAAFIFGAFLKFQEERA